MTRSEVRKRVSRNAENLNCELFVNRVGDFLFCLEIPDCFITGAESAYHKRIPIELTSNLDGIHAAARARKRSITLDAFPRLLFEISCSKSRAGNSRGENSVAHESPSRSVRPG